MWLATESTGGLHRPKEFLLPTHHNSIWFAEFLTVFLCWYKNCRREKQVVFVKGQLGVPLTVYPWIPMVFIVFLGILGDYNP